MIKLKHLVEANRYQKYLNQKKYEQKIDLLNQIKSELEKEKNAEIDTYYDDMFDTTPEKSINRKTSKEKPPLIPQPEEWKRMVDTDVENARLRTKLRNLKISFGTYDPEDTSLWTCCYNNTGKDDWDKWYIAHPDYVPKLIFPEDEPTQADMLRHLKKRGGNNKA